MYIPNTTHRFCVYTKSHNLVPDPNSFSCQSSKRISYFQRLYYEYLYTLKVGGIALFYTLTYNDKALPYQFGIPVFNYSHLRLVTNGKIQKILSRKYHCRFKYFISCERGDGKGKRGLGNNPHYHCIFFLQPLDSSFVCPTPKDFYDLIRDVWQGNFDWRNANFGHVQPGNHLGYVESADCFSYVCKYVIKDKLEDVFLNKVKEFLSSEIYKSLYSTKYLIRYYKYLRNNGLSSYSIRSLIQFDNFKSLRYINPSFSWKDYVKFFNHYGIRASVYPAYYRWFTEYVAAPYIANQLSIYKNKYGCKPRSSKSLGAYGLYFVRDIDSNPVFNIPTSSGNKTYPISLYYFRKIYYNYFICPYTGSVLYELNSLGRKLKLNILSSSIDRLSTKVIDSLKYAFTNHLVDSDSTLSKYVNFLNSEQFSDKFDLVVFKYCVYNIVYRFRCFESASPIKLSSSFDIDDIKEDYSLFLCHDKYYLDYNTTSRDKIYLIANQLSFKSHILFRPYIRYFDMLDYVIDCVSHFKSNLYKSNYDSISSDIKRLKALKFNLSA